MGKKSKGEHCEACAGIGHCLLVSDTAFSLALLFRLINVAVVSLCIIKQKHHFAINRLNSFSTSHQARRVQMMELYESV